MAAAVIFCLLTVLKLSVPGAAALLEQGRSQVFGRDDEHRWLTTLLQQGDQEQQAPEVQTKLRAVAAPTVKRLPAYRLKTLSQVQEQTMPCTAVPADAALTEKVLTELSAVSSEAQPVAVEVFLASQADFVGYAVPANVSYDMPVLPFAYTPPVSGYSSSGFGYRMHPVHNEVRFHYGTDVAAYTGEPIYAFADGTVTTAGYSDSYGNYIVINHGDGWQSLYAHCSQLLVKYGADVSSGEQIALVGATGVVTGPHLHFELTCDGVYINPEYYVNYT